MADFDGAPVGARAVRAEAVRKVLAALAPLGDADRDAVLAAVLRLERAEGDADGALDGETAEERRRRLDRERKAAARVRCVPQSYADVSAEVPQSRADMSADIPPTDPEPSADMSAEAPSRPRLSLSSDSGISSPRSGALSGNVRVADARGDAETSFPIAEDAALDEEWRAAAQILGVANLDEVWLAFRAHHLSKSTVSTARGWRALFVDSWIRREKRYQAGGRANGRRPRVVQSDAGKPQVWQAAKPEDFEPPSAPVAAGGRR